MDIEIDVPGIDEPRAYEVDLRTVMDQLTSSHFENVIRLDDFSIEISPLTYKEFTEAAMKTFEEQRVFRIVNDTEMTESEKLSKFNESFNRLTDLNISSIVKSVKCVTFDNEEPVTNTQHIIEFFENADKDVFKKVIDHITAQKEKFSIKPFKVRLSEEDIAKGAPETMEIPISFDQSNFFA